MKVPGPEGQHIDEYAKLPAPAEFGESREDPVGGGETFHTRPDPIPGEGAFLLAELRRTLGLDAT